jgi:hypothetical protein
LERPFVAIPLAEIAQDYVHPETGETLKQIAARFDPDRAGMVRREDVVLTTVGLASPRPASRAPCGRRVT